MTSVVVVHGYKFSVYNRVVRVVLEEKGVAYSTVEVDPFQPSLLTEYRRLQPFGRVPALIHGSFTLYETSAIARYVDEAFAGPPLTPARPKSVARMAQVIAVTDNYGYWPMVRQVFAHRVFRPRTGDASCDAEIAAGLDAAPNVLAALDAIAEEGFVLDGRRSTLADCHLGPFIAYFIAAPEGARLFRSYQSLGRWWAQMSERPSMVTTDPGLPDPSQ